MEEIQTVKHGIGAREFQADENEVLAYLRMKAICDFVWLILFYTFAYGMNPSMSVVGELQMHATVLQSSPGAYIPFMVIGIVISTAVILAIDTIITGAISGWYAFGDMKAGMIPTWRLISVVRLYG